jgi:hypothetical protein
VLAIDRDDWRRGEILLASAWNAERVGEALVEAFVTLDRLPRVQGPRQPGGHWPGILREWSDQLGIDPLERKMREEAANQTVVKPTSEEILHMETAFDWLKELRERESEIALVVTLWALRAAQGRSIKQLCRERRWSRRTFWRKRSRGLEIMVELLNRRAVLVF